MASPSSTSRISSPEPKRFRLIILIPTLVGSSNDTNFGEKILEVARWCMGFAATTEVRSACLTPKNWVNFVIRFLRSWKSVPGLVNDDLFSPSDVSV